MQLVPQVRLNVNTNVGTWSRCTQGVDDDCSFTAGEPKNHVSGAYKPPRYRPDPVRAHYRKRLNGQAHPRDFYNDDLVTPIKRNSIDEPDTLKKFQASHPHMKMLQHRPHEGYNPEDHEDYPHLVRWSKEEWKQAGDSDEEQDTDAGESEDENVPAAEAGESESETRRGPEEEEDVIGLRKGVSTMQPGLHPKGVSWEDSARDRLNNTFSGTPQEDGSWVENESTLDDRDDQHAADFLEYEPKHMELPNLGGYYKTNRLDLHGEHPWRQAEASRADFPNTAYSDIMNSNSEHGRLPGVVINSWGAIQSDAKSRASSTNDFIPSEPASDRIRRRHRVVISDQEMSENVGTGGLMGRDEGEGTDDSWVESHHSRRTMYPVSADAAEDLTGEQVWH